MSSEAVGWVFRHSPYNGAVFAVHLAVADSVNDQAGYEFWMRQNACAEKARVSRQAVNHALARMVQDGFLVLVREGNGGANRYQFLMPSDTPPKLSMPARGVSTQLTPPQSEGVNTDDNPVNHVDTQPPPRVSTQTTTLSTTFTGGVTHGDTEPKRTQLNPTSSSAPPTTASREEEASLIDAAINILAADHLERRQGAPIQAVDRWMAATRKGLHRQHGDAARSLLAAEAGHTPTSLALALEPPGTMTPDVDPLERTAAAARAMQERDRSCPHCSGSGHRLTATGDAVPCDHTEAA